MQPMHPESHCGDLEAPDVSCDLSSSKPCSVAETYFTTSIGTSKAAKLETGTSKAAELETAKLTDSWHISIGPKDTLAHLDKHGHGSVNVHDVRVGLHEARWMRQAAIYLFVLSIVLLVSFCGTTYLAIVWSREVHVKQATLTDSEGNAVSTRSRVGAISGVSEGNQQRRLGVSSDGGIGLSNLTVTHSSFVETRNGYADGKAFWVVALPDATERTVSIYGMDGMQAWGGCSSWWGAVTWTASCQDNANATDVCGITWDGAEGFDWAAYHAVVGERRLAEQDDLSKLLASRANNALDEEGQASMVTMDRSLQSSKSSI